MTSIPPRSPGTARKSCPPRTTATPPRRWRPRSRPNRPRSRSQIRWQPWYTTAAPPEEAPRYGTLQPVDPVGGFADTGKEFGGADGGGGPLPAVGVVAVGAGVLDRAGE